MDAVVVLAAQVTVFGCDVDMGVFVFLADNSMVDGGILGKEGFGVLR